jgi:hypothetical protein
MTDNNEPMDGPAAENVEEQYGKYLQYQGDAPRCADFSISMVCNIYFDAKGQSTAKCDVDKITQYIESRFLGKFPLLNAGTSPFGVMDALGMLGIPFSFHLFGTQTGIGKGLLSGKIIIISEGKIFDPKKDHQTWGHVMVIVGEAGDNFLVLDPNQPLGSGVTPMNKRELINNWWYPPFHPCWIIG